MHCTLTLEECLESFEIFSFQFSKNSVISVAKVSDSYIYFSHASSHIHYYSPAIYNRPMKQALDHFILAIPVLFIKQFPYAWIAAITFWSWPPTFSVVFLVIILIGLFALRWQSSAWISNLQREHAFTDGKFYVDQPLLSLTESIRKILILIAGAALLAWLLKGQFGLSFWQIFLMIVGFTLLYRDTQFFGAPTTYVITDQGIGIHFTPGHLDYRLFLSFKEIQRVEKSKYQKDLDWDAFVRTKDTQEGLLMIPRNPNGFTKRIDKLFIAPHDREKFLEQLPRGYGSAL
jgi:hypothetical protein